MTINWGDGTERSGHDDLTLDAEQTTFRYPLPQYAASGSYTVSVQVADADGTNPTTSSFAVDYTNSQPSGLTLSLDNSTISAGDQVTLSNSFTRHAGELRTFRDHQLGGRRGFTRPDDAEPVGRRDDLPGRPAHLCHARNIQRFGDGGGPRRQPDGNDSRYRQCASAVDR